MESLEDIIQKECIIIGEEMAIKYDIYKLEGLKKMIEDDISVFGPTPSDTRRLKLYKQILKFLRDNEGV